MLLLDPTPPGILAALILRLEAVLIPVVVLLLVLFPDCRGDHACDARGRGLRGCGGGSELCIRLGRLASRAAVRLDLRREDGGGK